MPAPAPPAATPAPPRQGAGLLAALAIGYTLFAIYGSLVPLDFHPRPLDDAWAQLRHLPYLQLGVGSRADWVANILLFVPLAFFWLGVLWPRRGIARRMLASGLVASCAAALAVAIEFTQFFFPPRTVSLNDILAETLGTLAGIALWWWTGERLARWLAGWTRAHSPRGAAERLLYAYLFLLIGYGLLPLDLTLSVVEIYHKWQEGKVLLLPFSARYASRAELAYALLADVVIWIPAAFLWRLAGAPALRVLTGLVACAAGLEFLQLFVYSRVTSSTDILTAAVGAAIGVALAARLRPESAAVHEQPSGRGNGAALVWLLALAGWTGVLMTVFWYPFDFNTEWGFVHQRLAALKRVPFETYYYGTEFRAVTEVFHKLGFFFPLGMLLALGAAGLLRRYPRLPAAPIHALAAALVACIAAGIEAGQLFLPAKHADPTDWALEVLGGLGGYLAVRMFAPRTRSRSRADVGALRKTPRLSRGSPP